MDPSINSAPSQEDSRVEYDHDHNNLNNANNTYPPPSQSFGGNVRQVETAPQQASTSPGDGSEMRTNEINVPFKERVVGISQIARGTVLGNPDLKAHGEAILDGRTTHARDKNL